MLLNDTIFLKFCIEYFCLVRFLLLFTWWLAQRFLNFSWIYLFLLLYNLKKAIVSQILKISHDFKWLFTCIFSNIYLYNKQAGFAQAQLYLMQLKSSIPSPDEIWSSFKTGIALPPPPSFLKWCKSSIPSPHASLEVQHN